MELDQREGEDNNKKDKQSPSLPQQHHVQPQCVNNLALPEILLLLQKLSDDISLIRSDNCKSTCTSPEKKAIPNGRAKRYQTLIWLKSPRNRPI